MSREPDHPPPAPLVLSSGDVSATIHPALGGRLGQVDLGSGPVLRGPAPGLGWIAWGCYPLLPWSNRAPGGRLSIDGTEFALPVNDADGSAIHGLAAACPWLVVDRSDRSAVLEVVVECEPYVVRGRLSYSVDPEGVHLAVAATNEGDRPVPAGIGIHPWFRSGPVRVPAEERWPGEPIPTGPPVPVAGRYDLRRRAVPAAMDTCFTSLTAPMAEAPGVHMSWEGPVTNVVVYSGDPGWVCVEPVTMATNGFAMAAQATPHGVQVLGPGASIEVAYRWTAAPWS